MSLLLDARKKSQQADELRLEDHSADTSGKSDASDYAHKIDEAARSAGQNLFNAKSPLPPPGRSRPNIKLLLALGGTILLVAIGVGYLWYLDSAIATAPLRPISAPSAQPIAQAQPVAQAQPATAAVAEPAPQNALVPGIGTRAIATATPPAASPRNTSAPARPARVSEPPRRDDSPIKIKQQKIAEQIDPLLLDAYSAYQRGELGQAQQLYLALFQKDARNTDVLLGLATIAQQQGNNMISAQYYARILELDPRNAAANAGMSALRTDDGNTESQLKNLLREQGNSAALHFALGNLYAGQSRWSEAQQAYFNAYTLEPGNPEFAFNLAVSLDHLGQRQLAAQHYQHALQFDPSHRAGFDHAQIELRVKELTR
ncbi:MAG: hypothetical protein NUV75_04370 [Gallionella sp.]|nr:hypothetical protein [Gallionella sp.]